LFVLEDQQFEIKASFVKDDEKVSLIVPHSVFFKFAEKLNLKLDDADELQVQLLTCTTLNFQYSKNTYTVTNVTEK